MFNMGGSSSVMASFAVSQGDKKEAGGQNFGNYLRKQGYVGLGGVSL